MLNKESSNNGQWSAVNGQKNQWSMVGGQWSKKTMVNGRPSMVRKSIVTINISIPAQQHEKNTLTYPPGNARARHGVLQH
jgi:hypothetical protein